MLTLKPSFNTSEAPILCSEATTPGSDPAPVLPDEAANDAVSVPVHFEPEVDGVSDWMSTLDIINGMVGLADEQKKHLREQSVSHEAALEALQRELKETQQRLQLSEMHAHEIQTHADIRLQKVQADADAQVQVIRAEAEARVRTLRAESEAWVRAAEEQVRVADLRADTAERWLQRIDTAAKALLLGGHMSPARATA
ncbi:cell division protein DivIVA [Methylobacterium phyllosphaerae]